MVINRIHINKFGAQQERDMTFSNGLNIVEGENESGKTTIAAFLAFLFYGIVPPFAADGGALSGWADITCTERRAIPLQEDDECESVVTRTFRVERLRDGRTGGLAAMGQLNDFNAIYAIRDGEVDRQSVLAVGREPGEVFFGVSASVFAATALVTQVPVSGRGDNSGGDGSKTSGDAVQAAMERILFAADEDLDPKGALSRISERKKALYDPETGRGTIAELEKRRDALASAVEAQEQELEAAKARAKEKDAEETAEVPTETLTAPAQPVTPEKSGAEVEPEEEREIAIIEATIVGYEEKKRAKEVSTARQKTLYDAYKTYREMGETDALDSLVGTVASATKRAESLTKSMFRGDYVPDEDYAASLHLCAADMAAADADMVATSEEEKKLEFSVRRDNLKENQMRRVSLDGGSNAVLEKFDRISGRRSMVTVFGVLFLFFAVLALAATLVMLALHNDAVKTGVFATAVLGALSGCFFFYRGRFEKSIAVMLKRYSCKTEDELENFLEEYVLSENKLHSLDENKDALTRKRSEATLRAGEAARQAALLLSKLQPAGTPRLSPDRLNAEVIEKAADRIDRALEEITKQKNLAASTQSRIDAMLAKFDVSTPEALKEKRDALAEQFGAKNDDGTPAFDEERVLRELDFNIKSCAAIDAKIVALKKKRNALQRTVTQKRAAMQEQNPRMTVSADAVSAAANAISAGNAGVTAKALPGMASASDCLPDSALLGSLLNAMDANLRRERKIYAALTLASTAMTEASDQLHAEIAPRLLKNAGRMLRLLTGERWGEVSLDSDMTLLAAGRSTPINEKLASTSATAVAAATVAAENAEDGTMTLKLDHLSAGTQELAYLSLRMALIGMLYQKELPPLIFDEAFATLDDKRLARMVALLIKQTDAGSEQAIVFTCHKRERKAADALGKCNVVKM